MKAKKERVILSDKFMRRDVFKKTMEKIKREGIKNITIIGGSASGWSTAWLLLNGPANFQHNNSIKSKPKNFPKANCNSIPGCRYCCFCNRKNTCKCVCACFGDFKYKDWDFDYSLLPSDISIKILYRDKIKVFYSTVNQAKIDGYKDFNPQLFSRKDGYLYSYTGIRGNAKALYKRVMSGREQRIKLVKAETPKE